MKSAKIRVEYQLAEAIQRTAHTLKVPTSHASLIVFFGLNKKSIWEKTVADSKVEMIRREAKHRIAMTL